ncbi:MAG: competence/damage-inducible protein A [Cytophagales bacterium]|nr:MAG: competence/damage-inducible protein A [Cytophagales bacterium]
MEENILKAEIIAIGDEVLFGQILNSNAQWLSAELSKIGVRVMRHTTVADQAAEITNAVAEAEKRASIILMTGGLGPTKDDITKKTLAQYYQSELVIDENILEDVRAHFAKRGRELTEVNIQQAALPTACTPLRNLTGTAAGMWFERNGVVLISMPGVPSEMKGIMENYGFAKLKSTFQTPAIYHKTILTMGLGESLLAARIADWEDALPPHIKLAYLPDYAIVRLRITGIGKEIETLQNEVEHQATQLLPLIDDITYGFEQETLEEIVGKLLLEAGKTIATAESCTGGFLAHLLTRMAGSSRYFQGSVIAYSNAVKEKVLGVQTNTLETHGAVSEATIIEMAQNVRKLLHTDIGIATSGIAGPDGARPDKPVGTIWIGYADEHQTLAHKLQLPYDRQGNIRFTALHLLNWVRKIMTSA